MNENIIEVLLEYIFKKSDMEDISEIPKDESLLLNGILDSFAIIELVEFIESKWSIKIEDEEFSLENFGSINKIVAFIKKKI